MNEAYREAVDQNDHQHRKTIQQEALAGNLTEERIEEIGREATLWLEHLEWIHQEANYR